MCVHLLDSAQHSFPGIQVMVLIARIEMLLWEMLEWRNRSVFLHYVCLNFNSVIIVFVCHLRDQHASTSLQWRSRCLTRHHHCCLHRRRFLYRYRRCHRHHVIYEYIYYMQGGDGKIKLSSCIHVYLCLVRIKLFSIGLGLLGTGVRNSSHACCVNCVYSWIGPYFSDEL